MRQPCTECKGRKYLINNVTYMNEQCMNCKGSGVKTKGGRKKSDETPKSESH
jgi:DnaJ-class molecular chaperone